MFADCISINGASHHVCCQWLHLELIGNGCMMVTNRRVSSTIGFDPMSSKMEAVYVKAMHA